jgi:L-threonylcarbamoyladenylate synthase
MALVVPATDANIVRAAELLRSGELVGFPTETVYGVGADAADAAAVRRVFSAKGRPADHPLILHLPATWDMNELVDEWAADVPEQARTLAERFWPGPLTLVLRRGRRVPDEVTGGQDTVALRVPAHPVAQRLLAAFGGPVAAPSANRFGRISPTRPEHAAAELGDSLAMVIDGGPSTVGVESTILDLSGDAPRLLRPGGVSRRLLAQVLGAVPAAVQEGSGPRAPGRLASHYAPLSPLRLIPSGALESELEAAPDASVLALRPAPPAFAGRWLWLPGEPEGYARELYSALRELDALGRRILVEAPPEGAEWEAVNDRLARAAGMGRQPEGGGRSGEDERG